jgi:hypothetical protein
VTGALFSIAFNGFAVKIYLTSIFLCLLHKPVKVYSSRAELTPQFFQERKLRAFSFPVYRKTFPSGPGPKPPGKIFSIVRLVWIIRQSGREEAIPALRWEMAKGRIAF